MKKEKSKEKNIAVKEKGLTGVSKIMGKQVGIKRKVKK